MKGALKHSGLSPHQLLMVLAWWAWRGPWGSESRYQEVKDTCEANFQTLSHSSCPIYQELQQGLLRDRGWEWRAAEHGIEQTMWAQLSESRCFYNKGTAVSMTRFMGSTAKSLEEDQEWHGRLYGLINACLELGLLDHTGLGVLDRATEDAKVRHAEACDQEGAKRETMQQATDKELKAIRQASKNGLHLSLLMYADICNQDRQRMITYACQPVLDFHQESNATWRDVDSAQRWLITMCGGGTLRPAHSQTC